MGEPQDPADPGAERTYTRRARHLSRPKREDTDDPRRSRERALKILFQADLRGTPAVDLLLQVSRDDDARAMLDEVDELENGAVVPTPEAGGRSGTSRQGAAGRAARPGPSGSGAVAPAGGAGGREVETEAQRIWREERERAAGGAGAEPSDAHASAAEVGPVDDRRVPPVDGFTRTLVEGVAGDAVRIDELIARYARRWTINRMPVVDRTVLRLATYELLHEPTAPAVVINEAVELVKSLSTDDSGRYVNGVLDSIRKDIARREATSQDA
jgi:transcription antitermination protein NusB